MDIAVTGLSHKRAPVELRERLAIDAPALAEALAALRAQTGAVEAVILSTCNRVEIYSAHESEPPGAATVAAFLSNLRGVPAGELAPVLYEHRGAEAVRHLFRVASSLDSMVVGETQILGQVKEAYAQAQQAGHTGRVLNPLFQHALRVAKEIHTTTAISEKSVSVPSVAAKLAEKVFQDLKNKMILILGAGETGRLTLHAFRERGVAGILVVNRTIENARDLVTRIGGEAFGLADLPRVLPQADIVIACLATDEYALRPDDVTAAMRARRQEPMVVLDIAVPRNIHPEINRIDNVYLFNIDDLEVIVRQNLVDREMEMAKCVPIIERETAAAMHGLQVRDLNRLLAELHAAMRGVSDEELAKLTPEKRAEVEPLVGRIIGKILHGPTEALKEEAVNGRSFELLELAYRLFRLPKDPK